MKLLLRIRPHEFVFAKCLPLAVLNLPDQGGPGLRLRIEREAVRPFAVIKQIHSHINETQDQRPLARARVAAGRMWKSS